MKRLIVIPILSILALALTACGAPTAPAQSDLTNGSSGANTGSSGSSNPAQVNGTPATGPTGLQLAAGILKLDGTSNAVTAQEASQLLPLWQSLQQGQGTSFPQGTPGARPDPGMMQQMMQQTNAQVTLIQKAMTPAQIQAITAMNLSRQDIFTAFQQAGISMGGSGQGGGFAPNGGTFTPRQGTPQAGGTPGAFQRSGGFGGGRQGFGNFIPPSVVDGIVQYLQKKAGS